MQEPGALIYDPSLPHTKSDYFVSSIKHPSIIAEFDRWVELRRQRVQDIKDKYKLERGVHE